MRIIQSANINHPQPSPSKTHTCSSRSSDCTTHCHSRRNGGGGGSGRSPRAGVCTSRHEGRLHTANTFFCAYCASLLSFFAENFFPEKGIVQGLLRKVLGASFFGGEGCFSNMLKPEFTGPSSGSIWVMQKGEIKGFTVDKSCDFHMFRAWPPRTYWICRIFHLKFGAK